MRSWGPSTSAPTSTSPGPPPRSRSSARKRPSPCCTGGDCGNARPANENSCGGGWSTSTGGSSPAPMRPPSAGTSTGSSARPPPGSRSPTRCGPCGPSAARGPPRNTATFRSKEITMKRLHAGLLATVLVGGLVSGQPAATAAVVAADDGATVVQETRINARTLDLKINSPALGTTGMVRVLLPQGWDSQPTRTWPQVYLMHGCCEPADYKSWTQFTDVEEFTATAPVMVVMPTDGSAGMFSAWWNFGLYNKPDWETFHTTEVRQILERGYRAGTQRAIAGISIGGFGAMHYSFRHPGMFLTAASYSGVLNTLGGGIPAIIKAILIREGFFNYLMLWGSELLNADR